MAARDGGAQLIETQQLAVVRLAGAQGGDGGFGDRRRLVEIRVADREDNDVLARTLVRGGAVMQVPGSDALALQAVDQRRKSHEIQSSRLLTGGTLQDLSHTVKQ